MIGGLEKDQRDAGVTLVELLVVLLIVAAVSAVALPGARKPPEALVLKEAADGLVGTMTLARANAMKQNREQTVSIDTAERTYWVDGLARPHRVSSAVRFDLIAAAEDRMGPHAGQLRFFADGSSSGGKVSLHLGARTVIVDLDWLTGIAAVIWEPPG